MPRTVTKLMSTVVLSLMDLVERVAFMDGRDEIGVHVARHL